MGAESVERMALEAAGIVPSLSNVAPISVGLMAADSLEMAHNVAALGLADSVDSADVKMELSAEASI
jgi:hypothetical protein